MQGAAPFIFLFAVSGFSGLIYESIWTQYLKLFLGHAAYAQTLVLAIFMGGMALGAASAGRFSARAPRLLRAYALAEAVIGFFALAFHESFAAIVDWAQTGIMPRLSGDEVTAFKWGLGALLILPQSILLGMTFPLMSGGILRRFPNEPGAGIALLYFANSLGGAFGVLASGFVLIDSLGLPGTIALAGTINLLLAAAVWRLAGPAPEPLLPRISGARAAAPLLFLAVAFFTGTASFIYEIAWIRLLSLVLGSSTHAFELMLAAFIFGLAFGGLWIRRSIDRLAAPIATLALIQVAMGLLALSTLPVYDQSFHAMHWLTRNLAKDDTGYILFNLASGGIALAIMLPATFCAGTTLPLITAALLRQGRGESAIGAVYAANTLGAILGILFAVHVGLPELGLKNLLILGGGLDILLGLVLLWRAGPALERPVKIAFALVGAGGIAAIHFAFDLDPYKMASGIYRYANFLKPGETEILFHKDGKTASVDLVGIKGGLIAIRTNGKSDAAVNMAIGKGYAGDETTMTIIPLVPMALHPEAKTAANIGFGAGISTHVFLANHRLEAVESIEIEPAMIEAARGFRPRNDLAYTDPRSHFRIEDAKTFFASQNRRFDIIASEPSNPWVSGVANLFSKEFYALAARYLNEGGVFAQWLQLYEIDFDLVASVIKAIEPAFDDYAIFAANEVDVLIVARKGGEIGALDPSLFRIASLARETSLVGLQGVQDVEFRRIGDKKFYGGFFAAFPVAANSDYRPILDRGAVKTRFLGKSAQELIGAALEALPAVEMLGNAGRFRNFARTEISTTPFTMPIVTAVLYRDVFLAPEEFAQRRTQSAAVAESTGQVRAVAGRCNDYPQERGQHHFTIALATMAVLRPHEAQAIWDRIETLPCGRDLSETDRAWLSLYRAVGERNAAAMTERAEALLASGEDLSAARRKYLVGAAMLGRLAQGEKKPAANLWETHRKAMFGDARTGLMFRILAARAAP